MGVDDSVDVEAAAARIAGLRLVAARDAREDARDAREDERDGRRVVDAREGGDRAMRRATARMNGIAPRRRVRDSSEIVAMSPSRVVVSTRASARSRPRLFSTSRRVRSTRATIDDDDAVADAFRKMYVPNSDKSIHFGVFTRDVDPAAIPSDEERMRRRSVAARELTVIDDEERGRRMMVGTTASAATAAVAAAQLALGASRLERVLLAIPLFFAVGFVGSAKIGA